MVPEVIGVQKLFATLMTCASTEYFEARNQCYLLLAHVNVQNTRVHLSS